jgi:hypothetical protein
MVHCYLSLARYCYPLPPCMLPPVPVHAATERCAAAATLLPCAHAQLLSLWLLLMSAIGMLWHAHAALSLGICRHAAEPVLCRCAAIVLCPAIESCSIALPNKTPNKMRAR